MVHKPKNDIECNEVWDTTIDTENPVKIDCSECKDKDICLMGK